jgi:ribosome-binding protein aMBF1 (putative translation factor)
MAECVRCGALGEKTILFDAISKDGVVTICEKCSNQEGIPVIKRPTNFQLKTSVTPYTVYERLSRMAGLDSSEHKEKVTKDNYERGRDDRGQEASLRQIVDKTYIKKSEEERQVRDDLVPNFHWVVLRARRLRKLTQDQVAKEIEEPVAALMSMERGIVPPDRPAIVSKLENFFRVKLYKATQLTHENNISDIPVSQKVERPKISPEDVKFDRNTSGKLTIADLRELKKEIDSKPTSFMPQEGVEEVVFEDDIFEEK